MKMIGISAMRESLAEEFKVWWGGKKRSVEEVYENWYGDVCCAVSCNSLSSCSSPVTPSLALRQCLFPPKTRTLPTPIKIPLRTVTDQEGTNVPVPVPALAGKHTIFVWVGVNGAVFFVFFSTWFPKSCKYFKIIKPGNRKYRVFIITGCSQDSCFFFLF